MKIITRYKWFLWYFARFKVPLIGYLKPELISLSNDEIVIKLALNRRSKNHLQSMYFGALSVGADLAGGLHGFYHAERAKVTLSLIFKSFQAEFIKRPESDVYFICKMGKDIQQMILDSQEAGERVTKPISVTAYTHYPEQPETVAEFQLGLSIKVHP